MKTDIKKSGNMIFLIIIILGIQSCVYYEVPERDYDGSDGRDGAAFIRLNWFDLEPSYIDASPLVPGDFYWNEYYRSYPGFYTIYYEYTYDDGYRLITDAFEVDIKIWINEGEQGGYNYDGRDGADNYFDLEIYPDGYYDFYGNLKSGKETNNITDTTVIKTINKTEGNVSLKIDYRKVTPRLH